MAAYIPQTVKDFFREISDQYNSEHTSSLAPTGLNPPPPPARLNRPTIANKPGFEVQCIEEATNPKASNDLAKAISWIFGMITDAGLAIYKCGFQQGIDEEKARLDQQKALIERLRADMNAVGQNNPSLHAALTNIIDKHIEKLEENSIRARNVTLLSGAGLVCAAAGVVAGLFVIKWLLTAALVVGLSIAALSVYNYLQHPERPGEIKNLLDTFQFKEQMV